MTPKILVVDDSEVILAVTRTILEGAGFHVMTHNRATGCVALILQMKPDLVLLDVNMPTLTGDAVAKLFEKTNHIGGTTVLLHSTLAEAELERRVSACGAHGFIRKTDNPYGFLRQIQRWLGSRPAVAGSSGVMPVASPASDTSGPATSRKFSARLGTVLFADPDMLVLADYRDAAQREGYSAEFALSATQALAKITSLEPPRLVVADAQLAAPGLAHLLQGAFLHDPSWKQRFVVVTSPGASHQVPAAHTGLVLQKPVSAAALCQVLREAMPRADSALVNRG